jgi:hypothetical protein
MQGIQICGKRVKSTPNFAHMNEEKENKNADESSAAKKPKKADGKHVNQSSGNERP